MITMLPDYRIKPPTKKWPPNIRKALRDLQTALKTLYGEQAPALLLYGSYARGEARDPSDVDVVLLYPGMVQPGNEINRLGLILAELNLKYQVLISIVPISVEKYQRSNGIFWKNVRREGILYGI